MSGYAQTEPALSNLDETCSSSNEDTGSSCTDEDSDEDSESQGISVTSGDPEASLPGRGPQRQPGFRPPLFIDKGRALRRPSHGGNHVTAAAAQAAAAAAALADGNDGGGDDPPPRRRDCRRLSWKPPGVTFGSGVGTPEDPDPSQPQTQEGQDRRQAALEQVGQMAEERTYQRYRAQQRRRRKSVPGGAAKDDSALLPSVPTTPSAGEPSPVTPHGIGISSENLVPTPVSFLTDDNGPVVIFDWDDTLFPTHFVTQVMKLKVRLEDNAPVETLKPLVEPETPFYEPLRLHAEAMRAALGAAREVARVGIVTLARRPWVNTSAKLCLPTLDVEELLNDHGIPVYYAREAIWRNESRRAAGEEGVDVFCIAKRRAMQRCLHHFYGGSKARTRKTRKNVVSVGDSAAEAQALEELLWFATESEAGGEPLCKTLKLVDEPTVEHLGNELRLLARGIRSVVLHEQDLNLSLGSSDDLSRWEQMIDA